SLLMRFVIPSLLLNDPPTTELYPLSLHDALPISGRLVDAAMPSGAPESMEREKLGCARSVRLLLPQTDRSCASEFLPFHRLRRRSEEHTSELQSLTNLVCRLLLEKKKQNIKYTNS